MKHYDIIGDIHGYADKLHELLEKLGYSKIRGIFQHPTRKVIFIGDWIDRGPQIIETLATVRAMIDDGQALAVLGNHEYNALGFHYENPLGGHLRKHKIINILQHVETLRQFQDHATQWEDYLNWFLTIPIYLDLEGIRIVHACWDDRNIHFLSEKLSNGCLNPDIIHAATPKGTMLWQSIEETLKGKECKLPNGLSFRDSDGNLRTESRVKWWAKSKTYGEYFFDSPNSIANQPIDRKNYPNSITLMKDTKPIFFGHYWLKGTPQIQNTKAVCVDFSVAKGSFLTAYQWSGESELTNEHLIWV